MEENCSHKLSCFVNENTKIPKVYIFLGKRSIVSDNARGVLDKSLGLEFFFATFAAAPPRGFFYSEFFPS